MPATFFYKTRREIMELLQVSSLEKTLESAWNSVGLDGSFEVVITFFSKDDNRYGEGTVLIGYNKFSIEGIHSQIWNTGDRELFWLVGFYIQAPNGHYPAILFRDLAQCIPSDEEILEAATVEAHGLGTVLQAKESRVKRRKEEAT